VGAEVLISGPDTREGNEDIYRVGQEEVQAFWKEMMARFGSEREYNKQLINGFKHGIEPEIIIVVDKLLTGFDAPRNTVLYLDKPLQGHALLQAIARVNRTYEGKDFGYVIDYRGVIKQIGDAMDLYTSLPEFDSDDIADALLDVSRQVDRLPQVHSELWDVFKGVRNRLDEEEFEVLLGDEATRQDFYERLSLFSRTLSVALSSTHFHQATSRELTDRYTNDLGFFLKLRASVKRRYAEAIDFSEYEARVRRLVDTYVTSHSVEPITPPTAIFDREQFQAEVERLHGKASQADTIAYRTKRTIEEKWDEDPFFYRKFSRIIEDAIAAYREQRLSELEYLNRVTSAMESVRDHSDESIPEPLRHLDAPKAFYGAVSQPLLTLIPNAEQREALGCGLALAVDEVIRDRAKVRWQTDVDAQNKMRDEIDDLLYEACERAGILIPTHELDTTIESCIAIAKAHYAR